MPGRPRELEDPVGRAKGVVARDRALAARVLELDGALGPVAMHALGEACQARDVVVAVGHETGDRGPARRRVRRRGAHDDEAGPAPGDRLVVVDVVLADLAVRVRRADVGRHVDDAVGQLQIAEVGDAVEQFAKIAG